MSVMTWLSGLWPRRAGKSVSLDMLRDLFGAPSKSGENVTWKTALQVATVLACVRVIGEGIAQVPLKILRQTAPGKREEARDLALYDVLAARPNEWQTSFEYRETMALHLALTGNHFSLINRIGPDREIVELLPIEPGAVTVHRADNGEIGYTVADGRGGMRQVAADAIWHVRAASWNGWMGMEPVRLAREAIGLAMATETSQAKLHSDGVRPSGLYSVDGTLKREQYTELAEWIKKNFATGGVMILDRAAKFTPLTMTGVDAQHLETRRFQIEEICRAFRVMPIMVGQSDKAATYASAEQMFLAHVIHTLGPWYARLEQSINAALIGPALRAEGVYAKFNANALMRGDAKTRAFFYESGIRARWLVPNDARDWEDMNHLAGGDDPVAISGAPGAAPPQDTPAEGESR